ncbi:iron-containing alcohol dehydrogenase [Neobacillus niacini]|uniref:iron-containing alcohol dehydrogenase n=1 Tax=Neobacillus niacini TaxID=86668 RepID=UPI0030016170
MFTYYQPSKIYFGKGRLKELSTIANKYGRKCLLVTTENIAPLDKLYDRVKEILGGVSIEVIHFDKVLPNPTVEMVTEGFELAKSEKVDFVLSVGGGSSIDTAKVIALTNGLEKIDWDYLFSTFTNPFENYEKLTDKNLPLIAVSTTSGTGSQVTQAAVISSGTEKNTIFHQDNFPNECIVDPELMITLPPRITAATGFDAFTHAFESYINPKASIMTEIQSLKAIELVVRYLPKAMEEGTNIDYREQLAVADTFGGSSLANAGAAAPHPLSEIIGGVTHIPHGEALAVVYPGFIKSFNDDNIEKFAIVARIFNSELENVSDKDAAASLFDEINTFLSKVGLSKKLKDFNVSEDQFEQIINNPVLGFLPFGSKEKLQEIMRESY